MKKLVTLIALTVIAGSASAAWVVNDGTQQLITFESDIAGVFVANAGTEGNYGIVEPDAWQISPWNDNRGAGLISTAAALQQEWHPGYNSVAASSTRLLADGDGNGTTNTTIGFNQVGVKLGAGADHSMQMAQDGDYANNGLYFRILNDTGATVTDWTFDALVYFGDDDTSTSTLSFSYAIDNGTDPDAMTFSSFDSVSAAIGDVITTLDYTMSQTVTTAGVADGDYIVLAFTDPSGDGSDIYLDDIGVTAIPEPATLGLIATLSGAMLFIRRRLMM